MGGGGLKKEYYQIDLARGAVGPGYLSSQAQHNKNNLDSETEVIDLPKEPEERTLLERLYMNYQGHRTEDRGR